MLLRNVELTDYDAYVRMRCDPVMMAELGGPQPVEGIAAKVQLDVENAQADRQWIVMIVPDPERPDVVAGNVCIWSQENKPGEAFSEMGWMVLPAFQGQGVGKAAVRMLLERARADGRWGAIHALPGVTNAPSNGICRSLGFRLLGQERVQLFEERELITNHWVIDPATDLTAT